MLEKDRKLLRAFKECYANIQAQSKAGEEVDFASSCIEETEALANYTVKMMANYKANTPQELSEKKQRYFTPKVPYFQSM